MNIPSSRVTAAALAICLTRCAVDGGSPNAAPELRTPPPRPATARGLARRRPNIVFILSDDLDMAAMEFLPRVQAQLVARGASFANAFSATPLCCPSRASLLTGQYAHNHGVLTNGGPSRSCFEDFRDSGRERLALPQWLKSAGYRTAFVGKYLNRYPGVDPASDQGYVPPGWDDWHATFAEGTAECPSCAYYDYAMNDNGQVVSFGHRDADYLTDVIAERAVGFIKDARRAGDAPFFLWVAPSAPHTPASPAARHEGAYGDQRAPRTPNFNEEDVEDKPTWLRAQPRLSAEEEVEVDGLFRDRIESMLSVDEAVEKLVNAVAALGELEDTYFIFTSDNGFLMGPHRFPTGKEAPYEESIRVPLVIAGPGVPAGTLRQDVLNIDLPATIAEIAQATPTGPVDGRSLVPLFSGSPAWRTDLLLEFEARTAGGIPSWTGLRTDDWIFVDYPAVAEREYYDLKADPFQLENRAGSLAADRLATLMTRLDRLQGCSGASCRN